MDQDLGADYDVNQVTAWNGQFQTGGDSALDYISAGLAKTAEKIDNDEYKKCKANDRNLWVHITRVKVSAPAPSTFLETTPRQLQTRMNDVQLVFGSIQGTGGNAHILGAISFALFAVLSVFAF